MVEMKVKCFKCKNWICVQELSTNKEICAVCPEPEKAELITGSLPPLPPWETEK